MSLDIQPHKQTDTSLDLLQVAEAARHSGDHRLGFESAMQASEYANQIEDRACLARALAAAAFHLTRMRDFENAIRTGRQALLCAREQADVATEVDVLTTLAFACIGLDLLHDALNYSHLAVSGAALLGNDQLMCWALNRAGTAHGEMGDVEQAMRFLRRSETLARGLDDHESLFAALHNMATLLMNHAEIDERDGNPDAAYAEKTESIGYFSDAMSVSRMTGKADATAFALTGVANIYASLGQYEAAEAAINEAEGLARDHAMHWLNVVVTESQTQLLEHRGGHDREVIRLLTSTLESEGEIPPESRIPIAMMLYRAHKRLGEFEEALSWFEQVSDLEREGLRRRAHAQSRLLKEQFSVEDANREADNARAALQAEMERAAWLEDERRSLAAHTVALTRVAHVDSLTGLSNRRMVDENLPGLLNNDKVCVALVDIDHFKQVNDSFGHAVGDTVLRRIARLLNRSVGANEIAARFGGEEFLLVLTGVSLPEAISRCESLRWSVQQHNWNTVADGLGLSVSVGVGLAMPGEPVTDLLSRIDAALYQAKRSGRNRIESA
jgi:diguanylate cyclase (GGDEF)-like protein